MLGKHRSVDNIRLPALLALRVIHNEVPIAVYRGQDGPFRSNQLSLARKSITFLTPS